MRPRWSIACLLFVVAGPAAVADPYHAHPDLRTEDVAAQHGAFLLGWSQADLARSFDAAAGDPARRREILAAVRAGLEGDGHPVTDEATAAWLRFLAGRGAGLASQHPRRASHLELLRRAQRWIGVAARVRGSTEVPLDAPLIARWKSNAAAFCAGDGATRWDGPELTSTEERALGAWRVVGVGLGMDRALLGGHSCAELAADLLEIVHPHVHPARPTHLEVFSPYLLRLDEQEAFVETGLRRLGGVERLDSSVDLVAALRPHLPGWSALQILRLLGIASHNHAVELLLVARLLARPARASDAVAEVMDLLARLNHFYRLIDERYRLTSGRAYARPYHFHGAALLACELTLRGHPRRVVLPTGALLGDLYERTTSAAGQPDLDDVALHREGTRYGIQICARGEDR